MNSIVLKGLLRNIQPSHTIGDIEYEQADLIVSRKGGKEDVVSLKFKKFCNKYSEGDLVELRGNLRSYSKKLEDGKNKVNLYVFTYFDIPETEDTNRVELDGRICKIDEIRTTKDGKNNIHLILANNLIIEDTNQKLNSYVPCIGWGKIAKELQKLSVNTKLKIVGELHSREYKKMMSDGTFEFKVAHECVIQSFEVI